MNNEWVNNLLLLLNSWLPFIIQLYLSHHSNQKFGVGKFVVCFWKKNVMLNKTAFIDQKYSKIIKIIWNITIENNVNIFYNVICDAFFLL